MPARHVYVEHRLVDEMGLALDELSTLIDFYSVAEVAANEAYLMSIE